MPSRACAECWQAKSRDEFSTRQWRKGVGRSRCMDCIAGISSDEDVLPTERDSNDSDAFFDDEALEEPFDEGGFRWVALGEYVSGPREGEPCVAKWLKSGYTMSEDEYKDDIRCAVKAMQIVREFNSEDIVDVHIRVNIPEVFEFSEDSVLAGVFYLQEPFIEGYDKWNSNTGWYDDSTDWGEAMQALSHYSYHKTGGQLVLCDIQGGVSDEGAILSDPAILSRDESYGDTDFGEEGISNFFAHHVCNDYCDPDWDTPSDPQFMFEDFEGTRRVFWTEDNEYEVDDEEEYYSEDED